MSYYDDYSYENDQNYDQPAQYDPENAWLYEQNNNQNTKVSEIMIWKHCKCLQGFTGVSVGFPCNIYEKGL